jgi:hypothetical protein
VRAFVASPEGMDLDEVRALIAAASRHEADIDTVDAPSLPRLVCKNST